MFMIDWLIQINIYGYDVYGGSTFYSLENLDILTDQLSDQAVQNKHGLTVQTTPNYFSKKYELLGLHTKFSNRDHLLGFLQKATRFPAPNA